MNRSVSLVLIGALAATAAAGFAWGQPPRPEIALRTTVEDRQATIVGTVTADGKPVEGATVAFSVQRTFGELPLGQDRTLDDGTAAVPFPSGLPGGAAGKLLVTARITAPSSYTSGVSQAVFDTPAVVPLSAEPFPRALWSPRAPLLLVMAIFTLVGGAWCTFLYVAWQLVRIRRGGTPA